MRLSVLLLALSTLAPAAAQANLVTNGDFEFGPLEPGQRGGVFDQLNESGQSWDIWQSLPGWLVSSGPGIEVQSNRTLGLVDAYSGTRYIELDSTANSGMVQNIFLDQGKYELSFAYSPRSNGPADNDITFGIEGALAEETLTGPDLVNVRGVWTEVTRNFTVESAADYVLSFMAGGISNSLGGFIDSVSLIKQNEQAPAPAPLPGSESDVGVVPVPAPLLLLGTALFGLWSVRRKA